MFHFFHRREHYRATWYEYKISSSRFIIRKYKFHSIVEIIQETNATKFSHSHEISLYKYRNDFRTKWKLIHYLFESFLLTLVQKVFDSSLSTGRGINTPVAAWKNISSSVRGGILEPRRMYSRCFAANLPCLLWLL